jgi:hypothetical protein
MNPKFVRMNYGTQGDLDQMVASRSLSGKEKWLTVTLCPGDFVLAARYDEATETGEVRLVGQVQVANSRLEIEWKPAQFSLLPSNQGIPKWRTMPSFNMRGDVAARYDLAGKCRCLFPATVAPAAQQGKGRGKELDVFSAPTPDPGYIYVIKSEYGYKIGKSRNLKDRTRLFSVKLPFPVSIEMSGWSPTYSQKERDLHRRFAHKRLEGEWFNLTGADLDLIREDLSAGRDPQKG